jgi:acetyltransferase-like isoleucine patch superfamily enzyme
MIDPTAKIHPQALIENNVSIGAETRVWAFAHILPEVKIGVNCNICDHTFIENNVILGDRVTVKCGVYIWTGIEIADDVFIGPCVAFTNDKHPRSQQHLSDYPKTLLQQGCSIGANATILPGITIGAWSMVGAGSVVTRDVPAYALVFGNPARIQAWLCYCGLRLNISNEKALCKCGQGFEINGENKIVPFKVTT